jgi:hypothetical protein
MRPRAMCPTGSGWGGVDSGSWLQAFATGIVDAYVLVFAGLLLVAGEACHPLPDAANVTGGYGCYLGCACS